MMTVWQGSCQVKCRQQKSHGGMAKRWATKHISSMVSVFHGRRMQVFSRSGIRSLSPTMAQENSLRNVLGEAKIQSKGWFWWLIRGMMKFRGLESGQKSSSKCVCLGWFVCGCCWLAFHERVPWLLGTPKNYNNPLKLQGGSCEGGLWFFVRLVKQSLGELICVVFIVMTFFILHIKIL
jgi:hypothetical protein